jgi:hypothetical protein
MGVLDRLRDLLGGSTGETGESAGDGESAGTTTPTAGVDRGAGVRRIGVDPDDDRKVGSHGSHWDTVLPDNAAVRAAIVAAVESGDQVPGVDRAGKRVLGHGRGGRLSACAVSVDGTVATGYPVAEGEGRAVTVTEVEEWANDVEAQVHLRVGETNRGAFATDYFAHEYEPGPATVELAGLAYDIGPADDEAAAEELAPGDQPVAFVPFDGGDVDDYLFRAPVESVERLTFEDEDVWRVVVPTTTAGDGDTADGSDLSVPVYAGARALGEYRPQPGDAVEGVCWLQCRRV